MNYTVEFTANSGDNFVLTTTNTTVHTYATINFTHVTITVRASNQYGPGPKSTPMRIYTTGIYSYIAVMILYIHVVNYAIAINIVLIILCQILNYCIYLYQDQVEFIIIQSS